MTYRTAQLDADNRREPKTYEEAKGIKFNLSEDVKAASLRLQAFPKGAHGLTEDAVRATPEFQAAFADYHVAANRLRAFNVKFLKTYGRKYRAEMSRTRAA